MDGIAAQVVLAIGCIFYLMPLLGLGLHDLARDVVAFNLPLRVGQLFRALNLTSAERMLWASGLVHWAISH